MPKKRNGTFKKQFEKAVANTLIKDDYHKLIVGFMILVGLLRTYLFHISVP